MRRLRGQGGQSGILTILFLVVLIAMTAAVLDVGSWFRTDRKLQANADAAALAAAQELPDDTVVALARAVEYGDKNGGGVDGGDVTFQSKHRPNDTVVIEAEQNASGVFSGVFGIDAVEVHATAKARSGPVGSARYAAPIAVDIKHPLLQCPPEPCFQQATTLDLQKVGPGAFRLLNLDSSHGGTGPATLAEWIRHGYDGYMPVDWYFSDPGAKFNSSHIKAALDERIGDELLFPIYDLTQGSGANFEYHVIGWVGFVITSYQASGNTGKLDGHFTRVIWDGIMGDSGTPDFGARVVALVE